MNNNSKVRFEKGQTIFEIVNDDIKKTVKIIKRVVAACGLKIVTFADDYKENTTKRVRSWGPNNNIEYYHFTDNGRNIIKYPRLHSTIDEAIKIAEEYIKDREILENKDYAFFY